MKSAGSRIASAAVLAVSVSLPTSRVWAAKIHSAQSLKDHFFSGVSGADALPAAPQAATPLPLPLPHPGGTSGRAEPDFNFTPGRLCNAGDPDFVEYRYPEHIPYCKRDVTDQMKQQVAAHYGIPQSQWSNYEFDHLIPLAIGGDSHVDNLWPQPRGCGSGCSEDKDKIENGLYLQMKAGKVTQADAVKQIYAWFQSAAAAGQVQGALALAK